MISLTKREEKREEANDKKLKNKIFMWIDSDDKASIQSIVQHHIHKKHEP